MISLQLLGDVSSGTGHLAGLGGSNLEFDDIHSSHYSAVNQMMDAHFFRCISLVRAAAGIESAPVMDKRPAKLEHGSAS